MNPTFRFLLIFALSLCAQVALAQDAPMRLALLYPPEAAPFGDLLTSELSKQQGVTLLEREQIRRIFEEKSLNAAQAKQDWAKIGELLGAEGLVILEPAENKSVSLRLVWAERGIIVHETAIDIDEKDPKKAVASALPQIEKAVRKLVDLRHAGKSAVAMHIKAVNADSGKDPDLRQGLGLLFAQRMLDEPGWVVVDRRNLTDAVFEKDLAQDKGDQKLVAATHRLTLGFAKDGDLLKIRGEVEMPTGQPKKFEFAGKFNEPAALAKSFMSELRKAMGMDEGGTAQAWDPIQEANAHFEWAKMAYEENRGGQFTGRKIYEAASAAWALGLHEPKVSHLRAVALCDWASPFDVFSGGHCDMRKDRGSVQRMLAALDLAREVRSEPIQYFRFTVFPAEILISHTAGKMLRAIYDDHNEDLFSDELPQLRAAIREAVDAMPRVQWKAADDSGQLRRDCVQNWKQIYVDSIMAHSSLWEDDYAKAQERIENVLFSMDLDEEFHYGQYHHLWEHLEGMLPLYMSGSGRVHSLDAADREARYNRTPLLYPKKPTDEEECCRRAAEIMLKLANDSNSHRKSLALALHYELEEFTGKKYPLPQQDVWDPAMYLTDINHIDDISSNNTSVTSAFSRASPHKIAEFMLRVLRERKPNQFIARFLIRIDLLNSYVRPRDDGKKNSEEDAARLIEEIDRYRTQIETECFREGVPTKKQIDYLVSVAEEMEALRMNHSAVFDYLKTHYPPAPLPQDAFPVTHYQFTRGWILSFPTMSFLNPPKMLTDGKNIYGWELDEWKQRIVGAAGFRPPDWKPKRMWGTGSTASSASDPLLCDGWFASKGRLFFETTDHDYQITLHCLNIEGVETAAFLPNRRKYSIKYVGWLPPFVYYSLSGISAEANGERRLIERWNIETNKTEVLADSARKPTANPLDEVVPNGLTELAVAQLPNGDHGLLVPFCPAQKPHYLNVYHIALKTGEVSMYKSWEIAHPPQEEWAQPFLDCIKERLSRKEVKYFRHAEEKREELAFTNIFDYCQTTPIASAPFSRESLGLAKPVFPQMVNRSPVALCSFSYFEMGDIRAAISIGRERGRSTVARTDLVFFEPDGIKSVPLRFQMKPDDLNGLRQYLRDEKQWGDAANDYTPCPRVVENGFWKSDTACVANDTLLIANNSPELLWFLTKEEILEARKRAKKIGGSNFALSP